MDESRQPDNNLPFSWITFIYDLVDVLGEECRSPEETLECFAYVLETYYPNFRMTVYYTEDEGDSEKSHLILQKGYSLPMDEFERMIDENEAFIKPYGLARRAMFVDDYDNTKSLMGNVFDEGCAAHIPIVSRRGLHGWFTLSAIDKSYTWSDKERKWLPVAGHICGSYVDLMRLVQQTRMADCERAEDDVVRFLTTALDKRRQDRGIADIDDHAKTPAPPPRTRRRLKRGRRSRPCSAGSPRGNARSWAWFRAACQTSRYRNSCSSASTRYASTWRTSSPSSTSTTAPKQPCWENS